MKEFLWVLGGKLFHTLFLFVYTTAVVYGVGIATDDVVAMVGAAFITLLYTVSTVTRTIRIHVGLVVEDMKIAYRNGYEKAVFDLTEKEESGNENG